MIQADKINKNVKEVIAIAVSSSWLLSFCLLFVFCSFFSIIFSEAALCLLPWKKPLFSALYLPTHPFY